MLFLFCASLNAQIQLNGIIKDSSTKKPLSFATITLDNGFVSISDVDGKFNFTSIANVSSFEVTYIGYEKMKINIDNTSKFQVVLLSPKIDLLQDVIIINENLANKIIQKAIDNKDKNNPQKKLNSFQFNTYNKLLVSANPDSIVGKIDSVFVPTSLGRAFQKIDSTEYKFKRIIDKQHLFLAEKVSQFQFSNPTLKETVIGSKMAGFNEPIYEFFGFKLQSFSIYDSKYELFETTYKSPIAANSLSEYKFKINDTISINNREVFVIHFKNKIKRKGLEGLLYIDSQNFAIAKAVMRVRGVLNITGIHEFSYYPENDIWFPTKKNFKIIKGKSKEATSILGGRIAFEANSDTNENKQKRSSDFTYLSSETEVYNIEFNSDIKIKKSFISVDVKDNASDKPITFWDKNRTEILDQRSLKTYEVLDSIAAKNNIEKKIRFGRKIINGYLPFGFFDIDLRHLLSYNNFEGFRFGIGGITNEQFSKKYRIEGYTAYGLKDETFKYNLGFGSRIGKFSNTWIGASFTDDIREIASTTFAIDKRVFKLYDPRPINISTFYNYKTWRTYIETKIIPKTESIWQLSYSEITPLFEYQFDYNGKIFDDFKITSAMVSLQWNPFSDYMQTPNGKLEIEKRFPKFTFQFTKSIPDILENDFDFGKIDFKIDYEKRYLNGQKSTVLAQIGYAFGAIPITHLYNTSPNNLTKDNILQRITIAGKNSFETMFFNEFFSSEFAFLQLKHGFKRVEIFKKVKPQLVMVTRMAWGNLENPERHIGINYKTLNEGYFESGIELNQIYKGFGLSGFYRYGPNQLSRLEDNLAIKLSFILDLGLD